MRNRREGGMRLRELSRPTRCLVLAAAALAAAASAAAQAQADERGPGPWSPATELAAVNSAKMDGCPFPSRDGRRLHIASDRMPGGYGGLDIWVAERPSEHAPWGAPVNLGPQINSEHNEFCPSPQPSGRFMFVSNRPGGCGVGTGDIYATRFDHRHGWSPPRNLGCTINSPKDEAGPVRVRHTLYFSSTRTGDSDIYASPAYGPWIGPPAPVAELNSPFDDARPYVRRDGREIVFDSNRPGGQGRLPDVWSATRAHHWAPWSEPLNLGPAVNSPAAETRPSLSPDGSTLYFGSTRGSSQDIFTSTRGR
jgi:WD40-like Beta Propeller Repeat